MSGSADGTKPPALPQQGGILHQRRGMPGCPAKMAAVGFVMVATIGYFTLYAKSKPGTTPGEVAGVVAGSGEPKSNN